MALVFIALVVIYTVVAAKVDEWITISALGFRLETPEMFLRSPRRYDVVRAALFIGAIAILFGTSAMSWYMGTGILGVAWLGAGWIGRKRAFKIYRRELREIMNETDSAGAKAEFEAALKKSDQELMDMVQRRMKYGVE